MSHIPFAINSVLHISGHGKNKYYLVLSITDRSGVGAPIGAQPKPSSSYLVTTCTKSGKRYYPTSWRSQLFDANYLHELAQLVCVADGVKMVVRSRTGIHKRRIKFCQKKIAHFTLEMNRAQGYLDQIEYEKFIPTI